MGVPFLMGIEVICSPDSAVIGKAKGITSSLFAFLSRVQKMGWSLKDSYVSARHLVRADVSREGDRQLPLGQPGCMSCCQDPLQCTPRWWTWRAQLQSLLGYAPAILGASPLRRRTSSYCSRLCRAPPGEAYCNRRACEWRSISRVLYRLTKSGRSLHCLSTGS
jgi:hypothetical protein